MMYWPLQSWVGCPVPGLFPAIREIMAHLAVQVPKSLLNFDGHEGPPPAFPGIHWSMNRLAAGDPEAAGLGKPVGPPVVQRLAAEHNAGDDGAPRMLGNEANSAFDVASAQNGGGIAPDLPFRKNSDDVPLANQRNRVLNGSQGCALAIDQKCTQPVQQE